MRVFQVLFCLVFLGACAPAAEPETPVDISSARLALGLETSEVLTWQGLEETEDRLVFTELRLFQDDAVLSAQTARFDGVTMIDDRASFEQMTLENAQIDYADGSAEIARFVLTGPQAGLIDQFTALVSGADPESVTDVDTGFDALDLGGLTLSTENEEDGATSFYIDGLALSGFDGTQIETGQLDGLRLTQDSTLSLSVAQLSFSDLPVSDPSDAGLEPSARGVFDLMTGTNQPQSLSVDGLEGETAGLGFQIETFESTRTREADGLVTLSQSLPRMTLSARASDTNGFADTLSRLGYEAFEFSYDYNVRLNEARDQLVSNGENALRLTDGFTLSWHQDLVGAQAYSQAYAEFLAGDGALGQMPPASVLENLTIAALRVELEDQSLITRVIDDMAAQQGASQDEIRAQARLMLGLGMTFLANDWPGDMGPQTFAAINGLLSEGGSIVFEIAPDAPVNGAVFASGASADDLVEAGASIRHEPPATP